MAEMHSQTVALTVHNQLILQNVRPLGSAIGATLVSVAFSEF